MLLDFPKRIDLVSWHGLLENINAMIGQTFGQADRRFGIIGFIGVDFDEDIVADSVTHRGDPREILLYFAANLELERQSLACELLRLLRHRFRLADAHHFDDSDLASKFSSEYDKQRYVIGTRQRIVHRRVQSRFRARISREHVIDLGADSWEILQFLADHLCLQNSIDDMLRRLVCFAGAREKIRIAVSLDAAFGDHLYEDAAGHSE